MEERNDALKNGAKIPVARYAYACEKFQHMFLADAGCGYGYGTKMLTSTGNTVIGFDNSPEAIAYATDNYHVTAILADIQKKDFSEFEGVVCLEALCHLPEPRKFLKKIEGKPIVISVPIDPNPNDGYIYRLHHLSEDTFKAWLVNWQIIDEFWQNDSGQKYLTLYALPKNID